MLKPSLAILAGLGLSAAAAASAPAPPPPVPSMQDILNAAPASDWRTIDPENTLYMQLPAGRVIIELAPTFAPNHAKNIRALVREHFFDGISIVRSQDNYVVQWGWPDGKDDPKPPKLHKAKPKLQAEFDGPIRDIPFTALTDPDSYAPKIGFSLGFPVAQDPSIGKSWLVHCYGMVGAGRGDTADSGNGGELYTVIGHAPRHLDRNVTLVGRVVQGIELLSVMPRGTGALGFYETPAERTKITSIRMAADVPAAERVDLEALKTDSASFAMLLESRRTRKDAWFISPTGHINVCNVPLPVRVKKAP